MKQVPSEVREIFVATSNAHKLEEIRIALDELPVVLKDVTHFDTFLLPREEGATLEENALMKARAAHAASGLCALADDSGLEVDYLDGAPGVRSARYAGENVSYEDNNRLLLRRLAGVAPNGRTARFRCVMALVDAYTELTTEGVCSGIILDEPRGAGGFGYDPLFLPEGRKKTFAEMSREDKMQISHRGRALAAMRNALWRLHPPDNNEGLPIES